MPRVWRVRIGSLSFPRASYNTPADSWRSSCIVPQTRVHVKGDRMATVSVLKFPTADGADNVLDALAALQKDHLITIHDAAIVSWPHGKKAPKTRQLVNLVAVGTVGGLFWGMLLGVIFFTPLFGMAVGAAFGALGGAFRDYGIDDDFIKRVRTTVTEGTSALFLMTTDAVVDRVADALKGTTFEVIATNLSAEQEQKLKEAFATE
jgi:uncharacterized membrane protein